MRYCHVILSLRCKMESNLFEVLIFMCSDIFRFNGQNCENFITTDLKMNIVVELIYT